MDKERNRRFSTGQMKPTAAAIKVNISENAPHSYDGDSSSVYDRFPSRKHSEYRVIDGNIQATELTEATEELKMGLYDRDMSCLAKRADGTLVAKKSPETSVTKRHVRGAKGFGKRTPPDERPRTDIGAKRVQRHQFTQERSFTKQSRSISTVNPPISSRRMSCPGNLSHNSPNERFSTYSRSGIPKRKTRLFAAQVQHPLDGAQAEESRYALPKIIESIGTLMTEDLYESVGKERNDELKTSKSSSPQSFNSEKSADQIQLEPLESKLNIMMSPLTTGSEGNSNGIKETPANKNRIIETTLDSKQQDIVPSRSFNSPLQNNAESSRKIKLDGKRSINIDLVRLSASDDELKTSSGRRKQLTRRKVAISPQGRAVLRPESKLSSCNDRTVAYQDSHSAKNPERDLELKVLSFLRSYQPKASPGTLKVKAAKKVKPVLSNNSLREQKSEARVFINTDTCPSTSNLINQDRSWYYQDRKGKCRYLRVPESPVPPIEWVFQHEDA